MKSGLHAQSQKSSMAFLYVERDKNNEFILH
jgi:hypothetical protein